MLASSNLLVQEYGSAKMLQYLEHAARAGLPLMIKVSELDQTCMPHCMCMHVLEL